MDAEDWRRRLEGLLGVPATPGNTVEVLRNGDRIFPAMLDAIAAAEHTIDLLTYVYWGGEVAERFARELAAKAEAGVRTRVLLDAVGSFPMDDELVSEMTDAGCDVKWFRPVKNGNIGQVNNRTHRKVLVVDEEVGFTGGVGIAEEWEGDARDETEWRDTHVRLRGPAVDGLRAAFLGNWAEMGGALFEPGVDRFPVHDADGPSTVQVVRGTAGPGGSDVAHLLVVLFSSAEQRLRITTAYFNPDEEICDVLCERARSGVEVEVLLPGPHADKRTAQLAGEAAYAELLEAGVKICCYQPSMLHAKVVTVDGLVAAVGSANCNQRSVELDEEVDLVVHDADVVARLDADFDDDLARSEPIDPSDWEDRSLAQRVLEALVKPFDDVM